MPQSDQFLDEADSCLGGGSQRHNVCHILASSWMRLLIGCSEGSRCWMFWVFFILS